MTAKRSSRRCSSSGSSIAWPATQPAVSPSSASWVWACCSKASISSGPQTLFFFFHVAVTHGLVPRGIALNLGAIDGEVPQADQTGGRRQPQNRDEQVGQGVEVELAEIADGAEVGVGLDSPTMARNARLRSQAKAILRLEKTPTQ